MVEGVEVSFLLIASSMRFFMCCSRLVFFDEVVSWMASAVASVAVRISLFLNLAAIIEVRFCVSSCLLSSSCSSKVDGIINPSTCSATAEMNFLSSSDPVRKNISLFLFSKGWYPGRNRLVYSVFTSR